MLLIRKSFICERLNKYKIKFILLRNNDSQRREERTEKGANEITTWALVHRRVKVLLAFSQLGLHLLRIVGLCLRTFQVP